MKRKGWKAGEDDDRADGGHDDHTGHNASYTYILHVGNQAS